MDLTNLANVFFNDFFDNKQSFVDLLDLSNL